MSLGARIGRLFARLGLRVGSAPGGSLANRDALWGKYVPISAAQYTALGLVVPTEIFLCDESSGNLVGEILGEILAPTGGPAFRQAVSGSSRVGVRGDAATAGQRFDGTGPNPSTTDTAILCYFGNLDPPNDAAVRRIVVFGTDGSDIGVGSYDDGVTKTLRYRSPADIEDTTSGFDSGPHCFLVAHDVTNTRSLFVTELEAFVPTYGAASSGTAFGIGAVGGGGFDAVTVMYVARFQGAAARALSTKALAKPFLQTLGFTIPWS